MLNVTVNTSRATRFMRDIERKQIPFVLSKTVNQLAFEIARKNMPRDADRIFQGGATAFTKRGFKYKKGTKQNPVAVVYVDEKQSGYMRLQAEGGTRRPQRRTIVIPTSKVRRNKYGNVTKAKMDKFFNDKKRYFSGQPKGHAGAKAGIWERYQKNRKIRMVLSFTQAAQYDKKFPFYSLATRHIFDELNGFGPKFERNFHYAMRSAQ